VLALAEPSAAADRKADSALTVQDPKATGKHGERPRRARAPVLLHVRHALHGRVQLLAPRRQPRRLRVAQPRPPQRLPPTSRPITHAPRPRCQTQQRLSLRARHTAAPALYACAQQPMLFASAAPARQRGCQQHNAGRLANVCACTQAEAARRGRPRAGHLCGAGEAPERGRQPAHLLRAVLRDLHLRMRGRKRQGASGPAAAPWPCKAWLHVRRRPRGARAGACDAHAPRHAHARRPGCACAPQRAGRRAARHAGLHAREGVLAAVETRGQEVAPQALCAHARCHYAVRCARRTAPGRPPPQAALLASTAGCSACEQLFCLSHAAGTSGSKHAAVQES